MAGYSGWWTASAAIIALYGAVSIVGGVIGYVRASSTISLVAGGISGIVLIIAAIGVMKHNAPLLWVGIVVALLLAGRFAAPFFKTGKLFPAGVMFVLGLLTFLIALWTALARKG